MVEIGIRWILSEAYACLMCEKLRRRCDHLSLQFEYNLVEYDVFVFRLPKFQLGGAVCTGCCFVWNFR